MIEFDEEKYAGTGVYLFASVLERFLGLYCSVNCAYPVSSPRRSRMADRSRPGPLGQGYHVIV